MHIKLHVALQEHDFYKRNFMHFHSLRFKILNSVSTKIRLINHDFMQIGTALCANISKELALSTKTVNSTELWYVYVNPHNIILNSLMPNDHYSGRTAPLTSKFCILYIYSTNIVTEYFKHGIYSPFFSL